MFCESGENCVFQENVVIGFRYREGCDKVIFGKNALKGHLAAIQKQLQGDKE